MNYIELTKDEELLEFFIYCVESTEWTYQQIADELYCGYSSVCAWSKKLNLVVNKDLKDIEKEYKREGKLTHSIANKLYTYDKNTGLLINKITRQDAKKSEVAGWKDTRGYIKIEIFSKAYFAHRVIICMLNPNFDIEDLSIEIDHKNHIKHDNKKVNLKIITHKENCKNMPMHLYNTTGHTGVYLDSNKITYNVRIQGHSYGNKYTKQEAYNKADEVYKELEFHTNHGKFSEKGIKYPTNAEQSKIRRKRIKKQTPKNVDKKLLQLILDNTPDGYHDDHIKPLSKGGLHEPKNIQYITAKENSMKSDKYPYSCKTTIDPISYLINKGLLGA